MILIYLKKSPTSHNEVILRNEVVERANKTKFLGEIVDHAPLNLRRVPLVFSSTLRKIVCKPFTILCQRDTYEANGHVCFRRSRRYKRSSRYSSDGF